MVNNYMHLFNYLSSIHIEPRSLLLQRSRTVSPASRLQYSLNTSDRMGMDPV